MCVYQLFVNELVLFEEFVDLCGGVDWLVLIGLFFYIFCCIQYIGVFFKCMLVQKFELVFIYCMFDDWEKCSVSGISVYCNYWVIVICEYFDCYYQLVFCVQLIVMLFGELLEFDVDFGSSGFKLNVVFLYFDYESGYLMVWYFYMLISKVVLYWVVQSVVEDVLVGFVYLL